MTIARVADVAHVSYATAWRVVNGDPSVAEETARRVHEAIEQVGYVPSKRRTRRGKAGDGIRTGNVAMLLLRAGATAAPPILHEIERLLRGRNLNLVYAQFEGIHQRLPEAVRLGKIDGLLGYGQFPADAITQKLLTIPAVWLMSRSGPGRDVWGDRVQPDNDAIGYSAATYLMERGHKRIGYMRVERSVAGFDERLRSFTVTAQERGAEVEVLVAELDPSQNLRIRADSVVDRWFDLHPRPTGLFIPTDRETELIQNVFERRGVPMGPGKQLQIISCDNDEERLQRLNPRPDSIDLNSKALAQLAVDRLMWRIRHGMRFPQLVFQLAPRLTSAIGADPVAVAESAAAPPSPIR